MAMALGMTMAMVMATAVETVKGSGVPDSEVEYKAALMMVLGLMEAGVPAQKAMDAVMGPGYYAHFTSEVAVHC